MAKVSANEFRVYISHLKGGLKETSENGVTEIMNGETAARLV